MTKPIDLATLIGLVNKADLYMDQGDYTDQSITLYNEIKDLKQPSPQELVNAVSDVFVRRRKKEVQVTQSKIIFLSKLIYTEFFM